MSEEFENYKEMVSALSREKSKEFSLDYSEQEFAIHRGIESGRWPKLESYPVELNPDQDGILDWKAHRQDVESHPELAQEFTQRVAENYESDLELQDKPEKDAPDWYNHQLQDTLVLEQQEKAKISERATSQESHRQEQQNEIEWLHQLLKHVQHNLEHYQTATQQLRQEQSLSKEEKHFQYMSNQY